MKYLVTGCAGFIGSHLCESLCYNDENIVIGIDNLNDYYDIEIKKSNLNILNKFKNFTFYKEDICNTNLIKTEKPNKICHLASMAGVRYSILNPFEYIKNNIEGFIHILEDAVKNKETKLIVFSSSSSVYGIKEHGTLCYENDNISPNSPYAASKASMEMFAKTYHQLYGINIIGLRFFTVYGPRGRPDMAPYKFLKAIKEQKQFTKFGDGTSCRDYTYIDDIIDGINGALKNKKKIKFGIYNLGNGKPTSLNEFIKTCEEVCELKAIFKTVGEQYGDVPFTNADISNAIRDLDYSPKTNLKNGLIETLKYL